MRFLKESANSSILKEATVDIAKETLAQHLKNDFSVKELRALIYELRVYGIEEVIREHTWFKNDDEFLSHSLMTLKK